MTIPPFQVPPEDPATFCCCDPAVGGCPHPVAGHVGGKGRCVPGCPCTKVRRHPPTCIHLQTQPAA